MHNCKLARLVDATQVLIDTRALQKDISQLSEKLGRTFAVTDELVFKVLFDLVEYCVSIFGPYTNLNIYLVSRPVSKFTNYSMHGLYKTPSLYKMHLSHTYTGREER